MICQMNDHVRRYRVSSDVYMHCTLPLGCEIVTEIFTISSMLVRAVEVFEGIANGVTRVEMLMIVSLLITPSKTDPEGSWITKALCSCC
jgi:hypothetical protein